MQKWHVSWNLRGQKYYAYLRNSQKVDGKVKTKNVYLGDDLKSAKTKLQQYLKDNGIKDCDYLSQLHKLGTEKGVPYNLRQPIDQQLEEIRDMVSKITFCMNSEELNSLRCQIDIGIINLWKMVSPKTAPTEHETKTEKELEEQKINVASPERIMQLYIWNKGMTRGKYQYIASTLNSKFEYDENKNQWTAASIKKVIQKIINKENQIQ